MIEIILSGVDGSGKSTTARLLTAYLSKIAKLKIKIVWFRYRYAFSYALFLLSRIQRKTVEINFRGYQIKIHLWRGLEPYCTLFKYTLFLDMILYYIIIVATSAFRYTILLFDRYFMDMMVDMAIETGIRCTLTKAFLRIISPFIISTKTRTILVLDVSTKEAMKRKNDIIPREHCIRRILYHMISRVYGLRIINTDNTSICDVVKIVLSETLRVARHKLNS